MKLTFLGACKTVTGSKYLISANNKKILVDCGLFQGLKGLRLKNWEKLPINPENIDAVLLTHAHIDHSGYLPLLVKNGFNGPIYTTKATKDLCSILLPDSGYLNEEDARRANKHGYSRHKTALPLYTKEDAINTLPLFKTVDFNKTLTIFNDFKIIWHRAGHILGAAMIEIKAFGKTILFSGDLGRNSDPLMFPPDKIKSTDYLILESTYGNRLHKDDEPANYLADIINNTIKKGGSILIPSFAVGRAQNLLYHLYYLKKDNKIPNIQIYLDSPMAISATKILTYNLEHHKLDKKLCAAICQSATYINTPEESKELINQPMPKIIISASGMISGGRVLHHLKAMAPNPLNSIILSGFQAAGTRGEKILSGAKEIKIHGQLFPINAKLYNASNMSAHPDYQEIIEWLKEFKQKPQKTFITHGEENSSESLSEKIHSQLGWECIVPNYLDEIKL